MLGFSPSSLIVLSIFALVTTTFEIAGLTFGVFVPLISTEQVVFGRIMLTIPVPVMVYLPSSSTVKVPLSTASSLKFASKDTVHASITFLPVFFFPLFPSGFFSVFFIEIEASKSVFLFALLLIFTL
jgi:hypothetical protein